MHEIGIDMVGPQPLQAFLDRRHDAAAAAVAAVWHFLVADPEFRDDRDVLPPTAEGPRQGLFRHAHAIGFGRIEAGDAAVDRFRDGALKLRLVDPPIGAADLPAAKPDRGNLEIGLAELPVFHRTLALG
jgi:hypothetical protein